MVNKKESTFSLLFAFGRLVRSRTEARGALPMSQLEALHYVAEAKRPTMQEVAHHQCVSAPSATAIIEELAEAGYLTRVRDTNDRRQVRLALTVRGRAALRRSFAARKRAVEQILSGLYAQERVVFHRVLQHIVNA